MGALPCCHTTSALYANKKLAHPLYLHESPLLMVFEHNPGLLLLLLLLWQVVLGIWGNADPAHTSQWVTLQSSTWPPGTDLSWDEATATCNNFITGFDINIVTGVAFASGNLQSKVLYAQACFRQGSWSFNAMSGQALQLFPLQFTASFVPKSQPQPAVTLKPAPPLFAPLPPDLFYPFLTSGASGRAPAGIGQSTLIATGLMLLLQLWVLV